MFKIIIKVIDINTGKEEKPNQYNTFWNEDGNLQGIQSNLKIKYIIQGIQ